MVAYGYHEGMKGEDRAIAQNGQVNEAFLEERRSIELESMGEWVGLLGEAGKVGWVLTLVSKADIWWNRRDEVMAYYSSDTYLRSLGKLSNIHIGVLPYFSIFHKFYGRSPLSGLVDDEDRYRLRVELIDRLLEAIDPENALAYALPQDLHAVYQNLVIKKHFQGGLTPDEEQEMASLQKRLQQAHMATPLIRTTRRKAAADHEKRIRSLNASIQQLNNAVREAEARESSAMTEQQLLNIDPATT